jgi:hypothetical protein
MSKGITPLQGVLSLVAVDAGMTAFWPNPGAARLAAYCGPAGAEKCDFQIADLKLQTGDLKLEIVDSGFVAMPAKLKLPT